MYLSSNLLFICLFIIQIENLFCLWKKSKDTLEDYIIDVLFSNSLTIIRCNPYESHLFRDITIESIGHIKCSNKNHFLPDNHIEDITLLEWNQTYITCANKGKTIKEEKTYLNIKHQAKNAFKKIKFDLIRVGSTGPSELHLNDKKLHLSFKHPPRKLSLTGPEQNQEYLSNEIYSLKNRPIVCRERQVFLDGLCSKTSLPQNLSYVCYYKIGVAEPPTIAEMEEELRILPDDINPDEYTKVDVYINNTPKQKLSWNTFPMIGILIVALIMIIIGGIIIVCCCCCRRESDDRFINSDTSIESNTS